MSLGIDRKATGDILIHENIGYLFCLSNIADYITANLSSVKHTTVKCSICTAPEILSQPPEPSTVNISSERLDSLISAVYNLGRNASKDLITSELVYVNSRLAVSAGSTVSENSIVSVRGYGRFIYEGMLKTTKKGRLCVRIRKY